MGIAFDAPQGVRVTEFRFKNDGGTQFLNQPALSRNPKFGWEIAFHAGDRLNFSFHIREIYVFPQNYAAVMIYKTELIKKYSTVHCIDIGDGTVDLMTLKNGMPDKDTMVSRELGMSRLREQIIDDIINDYNMTLDGTTIEDILTPGKEVIAPEDIVKRIRQETAQWESKIVDQLHTKVPDFRFAPTVFLGGGSKLLAPFLEATGMFGKTEYIDDIRANAVGYEEIAKMYLNG